MTKKCWANQSCFTISSASKNIFVVGKIEPDGLSGSLFEWLRGKKGRAWSGPHPPLEQAQHDMGDWTLRLLGPFLRVKNTQQIL